MGTWGLGPWDSDDAADWCASAFQGMDIDAAMDDAFRYYDCWGKIRTACYLLRVLGVSAYVWPGDLDRLDEHIDKGLELLRGMAEPGGEYLELWGEGGHPEIEARLAEEIAALEAIKR